MNNNPSETHTPHNPNNVVQPQYTNEYFGNSQVEMPTYPPVQQHNPYDQPQSQPQSQPQPQPQQLQYQDQYQDLKDAPPVYDSYTQPVPNYANSQPYIDSSIPPPPQQQQFQPQLPVLITQNIPLYPPLENIRTAVPPVYLISPIPREVLLEAQPSTYSLSQQQYDSKRSGCQNCEGCLSIIGLIGLAAAGGGIAGGFLTGLFPLFIVLFVLAFVCILSYLCAFIFRTYLCCPCLKDKDESHDQSCLSTPYYTSIFRDRDAFDTTPIEKSIKQLQNDIPVLVFHVRCYHSSGSGKRRHTVTTYSQDHYVPILHFRFMGESKESFLHSLDELLNGDVSIQYCPKFIHHPDQIDYISRFYQLVLLANRHRDTSIAIHTKLATMDPFNVIDPKINPALFPFSDVVEFTRVVDDNDGSSSDDDNPNSPKRTKTLTNRLNISMKTSLSDHSDIYSASGSIHTKASCCVRCCVHPFTWVIGILGCCASCLLCCWHSRFSQVRYQATFHILFPRFEEFSSAYTNNMDAFIFNNAKAPVLQHHSSFQQPSQSPSMHTSIQIAPQGY